MLETVLYTMGALLLAGALAAAAQIGEPGGYPAPRPRAPGAGPGIPQGGIPTPRLPGRKKSQQKKRPPAAENQIAIRGMLRRLEEGRLIIEHPDGRIIRMVWDDTTLFQEKGVEIKPAVIQPGDHVLVEGSQDDEGAYYAGQVTREKEGTEAERATARAPVPEMPTLSDDKPEPPKRADGPPRMTRGGARPEPKPEAPQQETREEPEAREVFTIDGTIPESARDAEAPPRLARGPRPPGTPGVVAVPYVPGVVLPPPAPEPAVVAEQVKDPDPPDPLIEKAREVALHFVDSLPNYTVKQLTTRFYTTNSGKDWHAKDLFAADVVYEGGKEHYRNVTLNGKPAKGKVEQTGAWSTGEFGTVLRELFTPYTATDFRSRGPATILNRSARMFQYYVDQARSRWHIASVSQTYFPAYKGTVWIDVNTAKVLRIEMQARGLPREFPFDVVESATDYDYVRLGESQFLLPAHSETLTCIRGTSRCSKNVIEFRNYKKFGAESTVTFTP